MSTGTIFDFFNGGPSLEEGVAEEVAPTLQRNIPIEGEIEEEMMSPAQSAGAQRVRSIAGAPIKGALKEIRTEMDKIKKVPLPSFLQKFAPTEEEIATDFSAFESEMNELFPTQEKFLEKSLERGGRMAPYAALGGNVVPGVLRSLLAGILGETAKELGLPEGVQTGAELLAFAAPNIFTQKLLQTGKYGPLIARARQQGLSDEVIAPLIQSDWKKKLLSKLASRRGRTQELLKPKTGRVAQEFEGVFDRLRTREYRPTPFKDSAALKEKASQSLQKAFNDIKNVKTKEVIRDAYQDLLKSPMDQRDLIDFYRSVNANLTDKTAELARFNNPVKDALQRISPELGADFKLTNELYGKYKDISKKLQPNLVSDILSASQALKVMGGIAFGNYPILLETLGEQGAKVLAREMLINPRLQQIGTKMGNAIQKNNVPAIKKLMDSMAKEVNKSSPEAARNIQSVDIEELVNLLPDNSE